MTKRTSLVEFTIRPFTEDCKDIFINTAEIDGYFVEFNSIGNFERDLEFTRLEAVFDNNDINIKQWITDAHSADVEITFPLTVHAIFEAVYWQDYNGELDGEINLVDVVNLNALLTGVSKKLVDAHKAANTIGNKNSKAMSIGLAALKNKEVTEDQYITYIARMIVALE